MIPVFRRTSTVTCHGHCSEMQAHKLKQHCSTFTVAFCFCFTDYTCLSGRSVMNCALVASLSDSAEVFNLKWISHTSGHGDHWQHLQHIVQSNYIIQVALHRLWWAAVILAAYVFVPPGLDYHVIGSLAAWLSQKEGLGSWLHMPNAVETRVLHDYYHSHAGKLSVFQQWQISPARSGLRPPMDLYDIGYQMNAVELPRA